MNPWVALDVEKRRRLVEKGVLPTTFTGVSSLYEGTSDHIKAIPTFPHLLTPINQPFRRYQGLFGSFTYKRGDLEWGPYNHSSDSEINLRFQSLLNNDKDLSTEEQQPILSSQTYNNAMSVFPKDEITCGYCFFNLNETIYYVKKTKENYSLRKLNINKHSKDSHLYQLCLSAFSFDDQNKSPFFTTEQMIRGGGIFARKFNTTLINATYNAAAYSFLKKMEDNLYQLLCAHPYYLGSALIHGKVSSFLYHLLGIFHAMVSIVMDPLVEFIALVTRTTCAPKPDEAKDLFPEESNITTIKKP